MAASKESPIIFYDLASKDNTPWSPSTYKTRLALIHKGLPFRVEYLSYPDIESTMKKLGAPPTAPNGKFPYTVPVIADPSPQGGGPTYVSDSWAIALYLERTYPAPKYPALFPHNSIALQRAMGLQLSRTIHYHLCDLTIPLIGLEHVLDDRGHEHYMRTREEIYEKPLTQVLEEAKAVWSTDIRGAWKTIGEILDTNGPMEQAGLFVMGKEMSYSDFVIAGLILWLQRGEGREGQHYKELLEWDGGRWGLIWKEIEKLVSKSTEV